MAPMAAAAATAARRASPARARAAAGGRQMRHSLPAPAVGGRYGRRREPWHKGLTATECCSQCALIATSCVLLLVGIIFLANTATNHRSELVDTYDETVEIWNNSGRHEMENLSVTVDMSVVLEAAWAAGGGAAAPAGWNQTLAMWQSDATDWSFDADSEAGEGLDAYKPLKYFSRFVMPLVDDGHLAVALGGSEVAGPTVQAEFPPQAPLPAYGEAPTATFRFDLKAPDGRTGSLTTGPFPLAYSVIVPPQTQWAQSSCRDQRGLWLHNRCYVAKRLEDICVQIQQDSSGKWSFHDKLVEPLPALSRREAEHSGLRHGCDPHTRWDPAAYEVDRCWAQPLGHVGCRTMAAQQQEILVVLRSWNDPYVEAEELTDGDFDFGLSAETQRATAWALLILGFVFGIAAGLRCYLMSLGDDFETDVFLDYFPESVPVGRATGGRSERQYCQDSELG